VKQKAHWDKTAITATLQIKLHAIFYVCAGIRIGLMQMQRAVQSR